MYLIANVKTLSIFYVVPILITALCACGEVISTSRSANVSLSVQKRGPDVIVIYADYISVREFEAYKSLAWSGFREETVSNPQIAHSAKKAGYGSTWAGKTQVDHTGNYESYGFDESVCTPGTVDPELSSYTYFGVLAVKKDGNNNWWDVSKTPSDLDNFKPVTYWDKVSLNHLKEGDKLNRILPRFDEYNTKHDSMYKLY